MKNAQREDMDRFKSSLDDPEQAQFAWDRYKRLMIWMAGLSAFTAIVGLIVMYNIVENLTIHMVIATLLGVFFSVMLGTALMGLVFLSAGTGHDESIHDPFEDLNP
jgi:uncharacterized membrane protein